MKIGVITPVRNAKKFIHKAVESVNHQIFDADILLTHYIYDDASDDGTLDGFPIIDNIIIGKTRVGQSKARNILIDMAKREGCDILAFLDADDVWEPNHIRFSLDLLGASNDIVYSTPTFVDDCGNLMNPINIVIPHFFIGRQLEHNNFIYISSVVAKIKCFKKNEFDSTLDSVEDWDMWYRLFKQGFNFIKDPIGSVKYRINPNGEGSKSQSVMGWLAKKNNFNLPELKLHLACGEDYQPDYINVDLYPLPTAKIDAKFDIKKLPYDNCTIDCIRALHVIEHFTFKECKGVFNEWFRVLNLGGKLIVETPDFLNTCKEFVNTDEQGRINLYGHFFAFPDMPGQIHKFLFTETQLRCQLEWAGFKNITRIDPMSNYVTPGRSHLFLAMEACK